MMAKIVKGSDFKGAVDYIIDKKKDTQIVASEGLFMENLVNVILLVFILLYTNKIAVIAPCKRNRIETKSVF